MHKKIHQSGMSLIELLVALGISSIVALGLAMALDNMNKGQKRVSLVASLTEKKSYFQTILNADNTFTNTIAATVNTNMQCLRDKTTCSASYVASAYSATLDQITLYNNAPTPGAPLHNGRVTSNKGFTEKGAECTGFSATGPGNDDCPVGYIINWYLSNTGATEGISLTITAKMVFNPSDNHKLKKLINANLSTPLGAYDAQATKNVRNFINYTVPTCNLSGISLNNGSSYPFYQTSSVPTGSRCISEFRNCSIFNNNPQLSGSYTNATCVQNCSGSWGACSVACGGGTQKYTITVPANQWGAACPAADGATQVCNTAACTAAPTCTSYMNYFDPWPTNLCEGMGATAQSNNTCSRWWDNLPAGQTSCVDCPPHKAANPGWNGCVEYTTVCCW